MSKYAPHTVLSLLKLKSKFHNSKLELIGQQIRMNKFGLKGSISDKNDMIHILNNLSKEYDIILNKL